MTLSSAISRRNMLIAAAALAATSAFAQGYPTRPIQLVVPFPAGGATDVIGRVVGQKLAEVIGQPVVVENKAGAGTIIGASYTSKAAADGYTLMISSGSTFTVNPAINPKLPYDAIKGFTPIGLVGRSPLLVLANPQIPANNLQQLLKEVKEHPNKYVYGSFGAGTTGQFTGELLWNTMGIKLEHVAYKGSAPAITDLIGGQIPLSIDTIAAAQQHVKSGKLKVLAVTGAKRTSLMPSTPTVAESGWPGFSSDVWLAIVAPPNLPAPIKEALEKALSKSMSDPTVKEKLLANGMEPAYSNGASVAALIEEELPQMRSVAARAGIRAD